MARLVKMCGFIIINNKILHYINSTKCDWFIILNPINTFTLIHFNALTQYLRMKKVQVSLAITKSNIDRTQIWLEFLQDVNVFYWLKICNYGNWDWTQQLLGFNCQWIVNSLTVPPRGPSLPHRPYAWQKCGDPTGVWQHSGHYCRKYSKTTPLHNGLHSNLNPRSLCVFAQCWPCVFTVPIKSLQLMLTHWH